MTFQFLVGEAIWDKPEVVAGREAHARALERRYSGLPQPLLLEVSAASDYFPLSHELIGLSVVAIWRAYVRQIWYRFLFLLFLFPSAYVIVGQWLFVS